MPAPGLVVNIGGAEQYDVVELIPEGAQQLLHDELGLSTTRGSYYKRIARNMFRVHIYGRPRADSRVY